MSSSFSIDSAQEKAIESQLVLKRLPITKYAKNVIKDFIFVDSESFVRRAVGKTQRVKERIDLFDALDCFGDEGFINFLISYTKYMILKN